MRRLPSTLQKMLQVLHDSEINVVVLAVLEPVNADFLQEMLGRFPGVIFWLEAMPPSQETTGGYQGFI